MMQTDVSQHPHPKRPKIFQQMVNMYDIIIHKVQHRYEPRRQEVISNVSSQDYRPDKQGSEDTPYKQ